MCVSGDMEHGYQCPNLRSQLCSHSEW